MKINILFLREIEEIVAREIQFSYFMQNGRNELIALIMRQGMISANNIAPVDIAKHIRCVSG